jgi:hypothetical protein
MKMARKGDDICARKYVNISKLLLPLAQAVNADPDPMFVTVMIHIFFTIGKFKYCCLQNYNWYLTGGALTSAKVGHKNILLFPGGNFSSNLSKSRNNTLKNGIT